MRLKSLLIAVFLTCLLVQAGYAQWGTITERITADPENIGTARWIKLTLENSAGGSNQLNDDFSGMSFKINLDLDGDGNPANDPPGTNYVISGDSIKTHWNNFDGRRDQFIYLPIRGDHVTSIRPRVKLTSSGALRIGSGVFLYSIAVDTDFFRCTDGIKPRIYRAYYYDDGSGHTAPSASAPMGNQTAFDGYIDRIDLIWSEPMDPSITDIQAGMFTGLGTTIHAVEPIGQWYKLFVMTNNYRRLTLFVTSSQPNTGVAMNITYTPPVNESEQFKAANIYSEAGLRYSAEMHTAVVIDNAGPAVVSAKTVRAYGKRRQPLADALLSRRVQVTFSEVVDRSTLALGDTTLNFRMSGFPGIIQGIQSIVYPAHGNSQMFEFVLDSIFVTENDTGLVQFSAANRLADTQGNYNGNFTALRPPNPPTDPAIRLGPVVPVKDGINPNILLVQTRDAILIWGPPPSAEKFPQYARITSYTSELASGGANGWGYLDWVDITFDHAMDTTRKSTEGFIVEGSGIAGVGPLGIWIDTYTFRVPLTASSPKLANTGVIPQVSYNNPFGSNGSMDYLLHGYTENLLFSDIYEYPGNPNCYNAVDILDKAGPAIVLSYTAGTNKIRITMSELVDLTYPFADAWPLRSGLPYTLPANQKFQWYVKSSPTNIASVSGVQIYFSGFNSEPYDDVFYLNHNSSAWTKDDDGAINFIVPGAVRDLNGNINDQWDNDNSLIASTMQLTGSDVKIRRDNIPPNLVTLETVDLDHNGRIDHYRFVFDDTSAIYPKTSFNPANWKINSFYLRNLKPIIGLNEWMFNVVGGDTLEVYMQFEETPTDTLINRPYFGDTGDRPDVIVGAGAGFTDWAGNAMRELRLMEFLPETDGAGPAITAAKSISTTEVEALISEDLRNETVNRDDFELRMGGDFPLTTVIPLFTVEEIDPVPVNNAQGRVILTARDQFYWLPETIGEVKFAYAGAVSDNPISQPFINGNDQTHAISVNDRIANHFAITLLYPGNPVAGVPFQIRVAALDNNGQIDDNFPERINLSSNWPAAQIDLPIGSQSLQKGIGTFGITCKAPTTVLPPLVISVSFANDRLARYFSDSAPIIVEEATIDTPDTLIVRDYRGLDGEGDQGGQVELVWDFSANHPGVGDYNLINYYVIYREIDGNPYQLDPPILAHDVNQTGIDSMRVLLYVGDNRPSVFWVRAVRDITAAQADLPRLTSMRTLPKGLVAVEEPAFQIYERREKNVVLKRTVSGDWATIDGGADAPMLSGAVMGMGRAIDNIPPQSPARIRVARQGTALQLSWQAVTQGINGTPEQFGVQYAVYAHSNNAYFNPLSEGILLATVTDTAYIETGTDLCRFYCVLAQDSDNLSAADKRVGKYGFELNRSHKTAYNYLSLPLENEMLTNAKASNLAEQVPGTAVVYQLDPVANQFSRYYVALNGFGTNFPIHSGMPVLVSSQGSEEPSWFYSGLVPKAGSVSFNLRKNNFFTYNEIIVPLDRADLNTADKLAKAIGGVEVIYKLDPDSNMFNTYYVVSTGAGTPFAIQPGEPVLLLVNQQAPDVWPNAGL
ncbi:MAG TPA: hypothetical protein PKW76_00265 [bacterium]|nr:hypothetical protein [bacterium]HPG44084.1 hypothetical protein [bacterium]HPM96450.1 hypothetical protein [bacterium]